MNIYDQHGNAITAPEGVEYTGSRGEGSFLVLRFTSIRYRDESTPDGIMRYREYADRYFNQAGEEKFRESGEVGELIQRMPGFWARHFS